MTFTLSTLLARLLLLMHKIQLFFSFVRSCPWSTEDFAWLGPHGSLPQVDALLPRSPPISNLFSTEFTLPTLAHLLMVKASVEDVKQKDRTGCCTLSGGPSKFINGTVVLSVCWVLPHQVDKGLVYLIFPSLAFSPLLWYHVLLTLTALFYRSNCLESAEEKD